MKVEYTPRSLGTYRGVDWLVRFHVMAKALPQGSRGAALYELGGPSVRAACSRDHFLYSYMMRNISSYRYCTRTVTGTLCIQYSARNADDNKILFFVQAANSRKSTSTRKDIRHAPFFLLI